MERGLLWFPLLILFFWLAWAGWNEYQKVEAYKVWAADFERAKYDILAVLGQSGDTLTWGKPTRKGVVDLQTLSRDRIASVQVWVNGGAIPLDTETASGRRPEVHLQLADAFISIPFTDTELALRWGRFLNEWLQSTQAETPETTSNE